MCVSKFEDMPKEFPHFEDFWADSSLNSKTENSKRMKLYQNTFILINFIKFYTHGILIPKFYAYPPTQNHHLALLHHPNPKHPQKHIPSIGHGT